MQAIPPTAAAPKLVEPLPSPALVADIEAEKVEGFGSVEFGGETYPVVRKPAAILVAEALSLAKGDVRGMPSMVQFLEIALGDGWTEIREQMIAGDVDEAGLMALSEAVMVAINGRPIE